MIIESKDIIKNPVVSVLVFTYNQERYISQCVEAILSQKTDFDFEILISDDCSTDRTPEICKNYQQKYPRQIRLNLQEQNRGIARNYGDTLPAARGKYVSSIAGDDFWIIDNKLQLQKEYLDSHPQCGLCFTNTNTCDEQGKIICNRFLKSEDISKSFEDHLLHKGYIAPLTWMYRREMISKYDINGSFTDESFGFALDIFATSHIDYIDIVSANYRTAVGTLSCPNTTQKWYRQYLGVFRAQQYYCEKYKVRDDMRRRVDMNGYIELLPYAIASGDMSFKEEVVKRCIEWGYDIKPYVTVCEEKQTAENALCAIKSSHAYKVGKAILKLLKYFTKK